MANDLHLVIDTREQAPWAFPAYVQTSIHGLNAGDYALFDDLIFVDGRETTQASFAIERKSAEDFAGTIASGWPRFCRELNRMNEAGFPAKIIIVEADFEEFCFRNGRDGEIIPPDHEHYRISPQFLMKRTAQLFLKNSNVFFAGNADLAAAVALRIFIERKEQIDIAERKREKAEKCK